MDSYLSLRETERVKEGRWGGVGRGSLHYTLQYTDISDNIKTQSTDAFRDACSSGTGREEITKVNYLFNPIITHLSVGLQFIVPITKVGPKL